MVGQPQAGRQPLGSLLHPGVRPQPAPLAHVQHLRALSQEPRRLVAPALPQPPLQGTGGLPVQRPLAQPLQPPAEIRQPLQQEALLQLRARQRLLQRPLAQPLRPPALQQPLRRQALRQPKPHRQVRALRAAWGSGDGVAVGPQGWRPLFGVVLAPCGVGTGRGPRWEGCGVAPRGAQRSGALGTPPQQHPWWLGGARGLNSVPSAGRWPHGQLCAPPVDALTSSTCLRVPPPVCWCEIGSGSSGGGFVSSRVCPFGTDPCVFPSPELEDSSNSIFPAQTFSQCWNRGILGARVGIG